MNKTQSMRKTTENYLIRSCVAHIYWHSDAPPPTFCTWLQCVCFSVQLEAPYKYISILSLINYQENCFNRRQINKFKLKKKKMRNDTATIPCRIEEEIQCKTAFGSVAFRNMYKYINCLSIAESQSRECEHTRNWCGWLAIYTMDWRCTPMRYILHVTCAMGTISFILFRCSKL